MYSQSYCIVFAYLVVCKHIRMHSRIHPAFTNTNTTQTCSEKLAHVHNQGLEIYLGQPHNDTWHVCVEDMRVWWRLWNRAGGFWLHLSCFFHKLCIVLRAETSCKHSGTQPKNKIKMAQDWRRLRSNAMFEAWNQTPGRSVESEGSR